MQLLFSTSVFINSQLLSNICLACEKVKKKELTGVSLTNFDHYRKIQLC